MYFQLNNFLNKLHLMSSCLKFFNLIKFNIIIIRYGTSDNYYTEQDAFLLVMLRPVAGLGTTTLVVSISQTKSLFVK